MLELLGSAGERVPLHRHRRRRRLRPPDREEIYGVARDVIGSRARLRAGRRAGRPAQAARPAPRRRSAEGGQDPEPHRPPADPRRRQLDGDTEMLEYARHADAVAVPVVIHDDAEREYAYAAGAEDALERPRAAAGPWSACANDWSPSSRDRRGGDMVRIGGPRSGWAPTPTSRGGARGPRQRRRFWIDRSGHEPAVRRLRRAHRLRDRRGAPARPGRLPGRPAENLSPARWSSGARGPVDLRHISQWWTWTPGASWRHPDGPARSIDGRADHPVVHVAYADARRTRPGPATSCRPRPSGSWPRAAGSTAPLHVGRRAGAGGRAARQLLARRLPLAVRARLRHDRAGRLVPGERLRALRHGRQRLGVDERLVRRSTSGRSRQAVLRAAEPARAERRDELRPAQPQFRIPRRVVKGGSFLCADSYCRRYRPAARRPQMIDTGMSHIGFRCLRRDHRT